MPMPNTNIEAKTPNQQVLLDAIQENEITFVIGPAGTGKTFLSLVMAIRLLKVKANNYKKIMIVRPQVATKRMPFLPGTEKQKNQPFMRPLIDSLDKIIPPSEVDALIAKDKIESLTLEYMRGMSIDNTIVILDEAQNAQKSEILMFLTRIGENSKFIITGDLDQTDLHSQKSGLAIASTILDNIPGISVVELTEADVVRNPLIRRIVERFTEYNTGKKAEPEEAPVQYYEDEE